MAQDKYLSLNAQGFIPGPGESEEDFERRVFESKRFFESQSGLIPAHHWHWASEQLRALFGFSPRCCAALYSREGLAFWQAAATWIDVKRIYLIRLSPSKWVSWLVDRNELLAHEAAHAARAAFDEPKYEEVLAYLTSSKKWRQVLGPLFRTPGEPALLLGVLGIGAAMQAVEISMGISLLSELCLIAACALCSVWSLRLMRARMQIKRAAARLESFIKRPEMVRATLFRMTDAEIDRLAGKSAFRTGSDLRWKVIKAAYWKEENDSAY